MMASPGRLGALWLLLGLTVASGPAAAEVPGFPDDEPAEEFLRTAEVRETKFLGKGVTRSHVVTLSDGTTTAKAVWKVIDEYVPVKHFDDGGFPELGFRDSYKGEIAAYRLDRMIGLDQVPPTVERRIDRKSGSLQLWMPGCMTEGERRRQKILPPDHGRFNLQMRRARVFFQLIQDVDFTNLSNLLVDPEFRVYKIDSSRAFRTQAVLVDPEKPGRYSQSLLDALRRLNEENLKKELGEWLSKKQRSSVLLRRDLIIHRAERLIEERGADQVLTP